MNTMHNESYREVEVEMETDESKHERLKEYEELLEELCANSAVLKQHGINPVVLIKLLTREINVLKHQLKQH